MKQACILFFVSMLISASVPAATPEEAFQQLLALEGTWEGKYEQYAMRLTYTPVSDRAAVMETMDSEGSSMVTIYHVYGNQLMATHYCKMKNQPRLVADIPSGEVAQLDFHFLDGTNLGETYTSDITLKFLSPDQLQQTVKFKGHNIAPNIVYARKK